MNQGRQSIEMSPLFHCTKPVIPLKQRGYSIETTRLFHMEQGSYFILNRDGHLSTPAPLELPTFSGFERDSERFH
jgi:hypothetical protein